MRFRKLKDYEIQFCELNQEIIEIKYYPKYAKKHRTECSVFNIQKGYAFLMSKKIIKHFKKCEIVSIVEHRVDKDVYFETIAQALLGGN